MHVTGAAAEGDDGSERLQSIEERFQWHVAEGSVDRSGGCTDAAMRMNNLLKVLDFFQLTEYKGLWCYLGVPCFALH